MQVRFDFAKELIKVRENQEQDIRAKTWFLQDVSILCEKCNKKKGFNSFHLNKTICKKCLKDKQC